MVLVLPPSGHMGSGQPITHPLKGLWLLSLSYGAAHPKWGQCSLTLQALAARLATDLMPDTGARDMPGSWLMTD